MVEQNVKCEFFKKLINFTNIVHSCIISCMHVAGCIPLLIHVHILGACVHMCARYEVSVIKPVAGRTVHRLQ